MRRSRRTVRTITAGGIAALLLWRLVVAPAMADADVDHARQQAVAADVRNLDKACVVPTTVLQELWGDKRTEKLLEKYADAILVIRVSHELMGTGDINAAAKLIDGKIGATLLKRLAPRFDKWFTWFSWAKTGMELYKDFVFDPMVERSQVETYIGLRKAGLKREDAYAGVRGFPHTIERLKKDYKNLYPRKMNRNGTVSKEWEEDFRKFVLASYESKYLDQVHREALARFAAAAAEARAQLDELRAQIQIFLEDYAVASVELEPASAKLRPGEQASFIAVAVYAGKGAERSAAEITADAAWSGGTSDNIFLAKENDVGKDFAVKAKYGKLTGTASISVVEPDCGDDGRWDVDARKCVCESGHWNEDLGECVSEEPESDGEVKEVLSDLEHDFYGAVDSFDEHYEDFVARLQALGGSEPEVICADANLGFSFDRAAVSYLLVHEYYLDAWELLGRADKGLNFHAISAGNYTDDVHVRDQIRMEMFRKDYTRIEGLADPGMDNLLAQYSPGCDSEDLLDRGSRSAEVDQNAESGIDIPGGETIIPGGGEGACGDVTCYVSQGPVLRELQGSGSCSGGSANVRITSVSFPSEIREDQSSVTVEISFSWSSSGSGREDVTAVASVWLMNTPKQSPAYSSFSGSRTFRATFNRSALDFTQPAASCVAMVTVGVDCGAGGGGTASAQAVDGYRRSAGN
ncbi:hypothetical protein ACFL6M_00010 [Candidatus Eisenbacteria bacterium]|uniref:Uncharacterized protein n=1 Tax=Eiseniibacteriota bacterium TaxID=2212470 RepID=A0ABV6YIF1_UNCEI